MSQQPSSEDDEYHSEEEVATEEAAGSKKKPKFPCIRCQENVSKNGVQCTSCRLWVHIPCQKISKDLYKILKNPTKFPGVAWYCDSCQVSAARLDARVRAMEGTLAGVEAKIVRVEGNVMENTRRIQEVEKRQEGQEAARTAEKSNLRKEWNDEAREREIRKKNIVVHRLPEAEATEAAGRKNWDMDSLNNILGAINISFKSRDTVKFCRRVGEVSENGPRPLVVGFRREVYREEILENARLLRDTDFSDIGITPDLTREQRIEEDELAKEAEKRNLERTEEDRSKNVEWILVGQRGEKRLIRMANRRGGPNRGGPSRGTRGGRGSRGGILPSATPTIGGWVPLAGEVALRGVVRGGVYRPGPDRQQQHKRNRDQAMQGEEGMEDEPPAKH